MFDPHRVEIRYRVAGALGLGLAFVSQAGCEEDEPRLGAISSARLSCGRGVECPSGARCGGSFLSDPPNGCENAVGIAPEVYQACRTGSAPPRPGALYEAFAVSRLPSTLQRTAAGTELLWESDQLGQFVACAIFGCQPEFARDGNTTTIANYSACVLAETVLSGASGKVQLTSAAPRDLARDCGRSVGCAKFQVDGLSVGCWMYDSHSIVAATELSPLVVSDVDATPEVAQLFAQTCSDPVNEGRACQIAGEARFGTCYGHECRPRCMTILECTRIVARPPTADAGAGGMGTEEAEICAKKCVEVPGTGIGVCMPRGGS